MVPVLVVTGPVGVGKSTVAAAISELLDHAGVAHAMVDLDHLRWCYPRPPDDRFHAALGRRNLAAVWQNYRDAGAERLVLADVVETRADADSYRESIPGAEISVVRLTAATDAIERRLVGRESAETIAWYRRRAAELTKIMDRNEVGDLVIDTSEATPGEIARQALVAAGWPGGAIADR